MIKARVSKSLTTYFSAILEDEELMIHFSNQNNKKVVYIHHEVNDFSSKI